MRMSELTHTTSRLDILDLRCSESETESRPAVFDRAIWKCVSLQNNSTWPQPQSTYDSNTLHALGHAQGTRGSATVSSTSAVPQSPTAALARAQACSRGLRSLPLCVPTHGSTPAHSFSISEKRAISTRALLAARAAIGTRLPCTRPLAFGQGPWHHAMQPCGTLDTGLGALAGANILFVV